MKENTLVKIVTSRTVQLYLNVVDLYYNIDYKTFKNVIICKLLEDYITHCESLISKFSFNQQAAKDRAELTFFNKYAVVYTDRITPSHDDEYEYKDNDEYELIIKKVFRLCGEKIGNDDMQEYVLSARGYSGRNTSKVYYAVSDTKPYSELISFLYDKEIYPFIKELSYDGFYQTDIEGIEVDTGYVIDDSAESIFNMENNFVSTNKLLESYTVYYHTIDYEGAKIYLNDIEKGKSEANKIIFDDF